MKSSKEEERSFGALYLGEEHNLYKKGDSRVCESRNRLEHKSIGEDMFRKEDHDLGKSQY
ncbi:hypothetical protein F2Q68_00027046 [Brassica cretica]|uniref:Uncharacterized protein n=2 Tax=Brassica cretica TaxID=69181 RepID=A0A8S9I8M0_BRACR|nr:hypothetical protein F2Q68_00027046 [Brassica cretica]KAF3577933.1 hypothetical protein DY000_02033877 [Brassica cretica]